MTGDIGKPFCTAFVRGVKRPPIQNQSQNDRHCSGSKICNGGENTADTALKGGVFTADRITVFVLCFYCLLILFVFSLFIESCSTFVVGLKTPFNEDQINLYSIQFSLKFGAFLVLLVI